MCGYWKLSNEKKQPGMLDNTHKMFGSTDISKDHHQNLRALQVSVPLDADMSRVFDNTSGVSSATHSRSIELWWDGVQSNHLDVMLITDKSDIAKYKKDFAIMYPGAILLPFGDETQNDEGGDDSRSRGGGGNGDGNDTAKNHHIKNHITAIAPTPKWFPKVLFDQNNRFDIFDIGYRHGHFASIFDTRNTYDNITTIANTIQLSSYAWIQLVFQKYNFSNILNNLIEIMRYKYGEFTNSENYLTLRDYLYGDISKGRPHPEKNKDFTTYYNMLLYDIKQKTQSENTMLSIRGMILQDKNKESLQIDPSLLQSINMPGGGSQGYEHLTTNYYNNSKKKFLKRNITLYDNIHTRNKVPTDGNHNTNLKKTKKQSIDKKISHHYYSGINVEPYNDKDNITHDDIAARYVARYVAKYDKNKDTTTQNENSKQENRQSKTTTTIKKNNPNLKKKYRLLSMFEYRLMPDPTLLSYVVSRYVNKKYWGLLGTTYHKRRSPPFLLLTQNELGLFLRLPDAKSTPNLNISRKPEIPIQQIKKHGFCLGYIDQLKTRSFGNIISPHTSIEKQWPNIESHIKDWYGNIVQASEEQAVVLSQFDIPTHMYVVGGTKSGKTTLIRCIAKHLEMANIHQTFENAFIFIDPKGNDSYDLIRQCETESFEKNRVTFLDPIETKFSINVLELPPYGKVGDVIDDAGAVHDNNSTTTIITNNNTVTPPSQTKKYITPEILAERRQNLVTQYVGYIMQMIKYWYTDQEAFVRLHRILETLLQYVYLNNDKPTLLDIRDIIIKMQKDGKSMLIKMYKELGKPNDSALKQEIESVASMGKIAYEPVLNRLGKFATNKGLRDMLCVPESTIKFDDMILKGAYTVIRLSPLNIPQNIVSFLKQTIVIKLWFAIQERANHIQNEAGRTQVLLALDEFQDVAKLPVIPAILTQARSYGLGLLLAHQTPTQISTELFEIITGNAGTQFVGRVSGTDASKFAEIWEPKRSKDVKAQLATQEFHHWTARLIANEQDIQQPIPIQFWPVYTNPNIQSKQFMHEFVVKQKTKYGYGKAGESKVAEYDRRANMWLNYISYEPPTKTQWHIMCILYSAKDMTMGRREINRVLDNGKMGRGTMKDDDLGGILKQMVKDDLLEATSKDSYVNGKQTFYCLPHNIKQMYFEFDISSIGTAQDIPLVASYAIQYYLAKRYFLCTAAQTIKKDQLRTDLIAYNYDTETPISVEIESTAEVARHPEHVKLNMLKWSELGFARCDVWSTSPKIKDVYEQLTSKEKKRVRIFHLSPEK